MNKLSFGCLVALFASACAAEPDLSTDGLPPTAARALELSPGANYVATLIPGQLRLDTGAPSGADGTIAQLAWSRFAGLLNLDPVADAAMVAMTAYVGPCGMTEAILVVTPSVDSAILAARVDTALEAWRSQHPAPPGNEAGEPADPALSGWVPVRDGICTILQGSDFEPFAITLTPAGFLQLRTAISGNPCLIGFGSDSESDFQPPPEALDATRLAGRALAKSWQQFADAPPAVVEAMPGGAQLTWIGTAIKTVQLDFDPVTMALSPASAAAEEEPPSP